MDTHYILKGYKDKNSLQVLQLIYSNKGQQVRLNSGIKIRKKDFDIKSQRILATVKQIDQDPIKLNKELTELKVKVNTIVSDFRFQHKNETSFDVPPDINYVKHKFYEKAAKKNKEFDVLINYQLWLTKKRNKIKDDRGYVTLYNDLKEFCDAKPICFKDITEEFLDGFLDFLLKRDIVNYTIKKKFKYLKTFLRGVKDVNHYKDYLDYSLKHLEGNKEFENIYTLTDIEYDFMKKFEVEDKTLMYARDLFLIGCNTSLRYSDIFELNRFNAVNMINLTTSKTSADIKLQVTPLTKKILEKYDYNLVQHFRKLQGNASSIPSNGLINRYLHTYLFALNNSLMKQGINTLNEPTLYTYRKGMERFREMYPKWKLITFHSSKKFFFTRCIRAGMDMAGVKKLTGNVDVFWRYVYGGNEYNIKDIF